MKLSELLALIILFVWLFTNLIGVIALDRKRVIAIEQRDVALKQADELAAKLQALQPMGKVQSMPEALGEGW